MIMTTKMKMKTMTKIKAAVLIMVAAGLSLASMPKPVQLARQAAINIQWLDKNTEEWRAICSGSFVDLPGYPGEKMVLSAGHCVDDFPNGKYAAKLYNGDSVDLELVRNSFAWPIADYAIFRVADTRAVASIKPVKIATGKMKPSDPVYMWSGPIGTDINYYEGYYSGKMSFVDGPSSVDQMDWIVINSAPGSSGTVVLNAKGEGIGILVAGMSTDTKLDGAMLSEIPSTE